MSAKIFWFTGLSGAGKTTICEAIKPKLEEKNLKIIIIDGDVVREKYPTPLGFSFEEVKINNLNIVKMIQEIQNSYDIILVPVISPYEEVRKMIAEKLKPNFYLVYCNADVNKVKQRDTKGLYKKEELGIINNLIGISSGYPYDIPQNADIVIPTNTENIISSTSEFLTKMDLINAKQN